MKKLLLIFVAILLAISLSAQTDHKKGAKTDVLNESTSGSGVTIEGVLVRDGGIPYLDDSITIHRDVLDLLLASQGDNTAPVLDSIVASDANTVTMYFNEAVTESLDTSSIVVFTETNEFSVNTISTSGSNITLTTTKSLSRGFLYGLDYIAPATGYIRDIAGNAYTLLGFGTIINRIAASGTIVAEYDFESSLSDNIRTASTYDAIASPGFDYTTAWRGHGNYSANFDIADSYVKIPPLGISGQMGIFFCLDLYGQYDFYKHLIGNRSATGGWEAKMNQTERSIEVWTYNASGDSAMAYSDTVFSLGETNTVAINLDSAAGEVDIWINAERVNVDSIFRDDFTINDTIWIGEEYTHSYKLYGRLDYLQFYDGLLTDNIVTSVDASTTRKQINSDITPPTVDTAYFGYNADSALVINLSEIIINTTLNTDDFALTADGSPVAINDYLISNTQIVLYCDNVSYGDVLSLVYTKGSVAITDYAGNEMLSFTQSVRNDVQNSYSILGRWLFNNDATDAEGNYNGVEEANVTYVTTPVAEGGYAVNANTTAKAIEISGIAPSNYLSFSGMVYTLNSSGTVGICGTTIDDNDGWELKMNMVTGELVFETDNGAADIDLESDPSVLTSSAYNHVGFSWDMDADTAALYVDGAYVGGGSTQTGAPADEKIYFGRNRIAWLQGYFDAFQMYDQLLTAADFATLNAAPGAGLSGGGGGGGGGDDGNFIIHFRQTFDENSASLPMSYEDVDFIPDWPGAWNRWQTDFRDDPDHWTHYYADHRDTLLYDAELDANKMRVTLADDLTLGYEYTDWPDPAGQNYNAYRGGANHYMNIWQDRSDAPHELYLSYWLRFKPGFEAGGSRYLTGGYGGKLPQMNGGADISPCVLNNCEQPLDTQGWSGGLQFVKHNTMKWYYFLHHRDPEMNTQLWGRSNHWNDPNHQWEGFNYYEGDEVAYQGDWTFEAGEWYHITQRYVHNDFSGTTPSTNALVQAFVNGKLVDTWRMGAEGWYLIPYANRNMGIAQIVVAITHQFQQKEEYFEISDLIIWEYDEVVGNVIKGHGAYPSGTEIDVPGHPAAGGN